MLGAGKCRVSRLLVAEAEDEGDVAVRVVVPHFRRAVLGGIFEQRHRGQRLVVDIDHIDGVARLRLRLGNNERHTVADEAHFFGLQDLLVDPVTLRPADIFRHHGGRVRAKLVRGGVGAGQDQQHAGRGLRLRDVDRLDTGMGMRRKQHHTVTHARQHDVVDIAPRPGEETRILDAPHCLPDPELGHFRIL